jgi:hypothetical protein
MAAYVIPYTLYINVSYLQCEKDIFVDYLEQCAEEPNMAISFKDLFVLQISRDKCAFRGKIEFLETIDEPWKVNITVIQTVVY